jgi:hypothetical protein
MKFFRNIDKKLKKCIFFLQQQIAVRRNLHHRECEFTETKKQIKNNEVHLEALQNK